MKIFVIITTKNRIDLLSKAILSVLNQTRKPDEIILVTDSTDKIRLLEKELINNLNVTYLISKYTHNYAGALNTGIHYIIREKINNFKLDGIYIATLDDDDFWDETYLEKCENSIDNNQDFVVSGLIYRNEEGDKKLSIPQKLSIHNFLQTNPHIQGSNTFIKLITLLKAGLFDENMSSTTDRDIFTRVMMLNPSYTVVNEHLTYINAYNNRDRITNCIGKKTIGLKKFYYKYQGFMTEEDKSVFFTRAENLFCIKKEDITNISLSIRDTDVLKLPSYSNFVDDLVIGYIATEYDLGLRLLKQIAKINYDKISVLIIENSNKDYVEYQYVIKDTNIKLKLISHKTILEDIEQGKIHILEYQSITSPIIKDIAVARLILHEYLYLTTSQDSVIWILDEDMELKELVYKNHQLSELDIDIIKIISKYKSKYDAIIGDYSLDAPLPTLSCIRTSLLDYVYTNIGKIDNVSTLENYNDYYYDLSDTNFSHLETPFKFNSNNIDDVFSGKNFSRVLFVKDREIKDALYRGGNTLIFNRELLKILNCSIKVNDLIGRRSDYFWVLQAKENRYNIVNIPFSILHNRRCQPFNYHKESDKLLKDLIGSSFTKVVKQNGLNISSNKFYESFSIMFNNRLVKYICSYYRVIGLLSIIKDRKYIQYFNENNLRHFITQTMYYNNPSAIESSFNHFEVEIAKLKHLYMKESLKEKIEKISNGKIEHLGYGNEGIVFHDERNVYKLFYNPLKYKKELNDISKANIKYIPKFEILDIEGNDCVMYTYRKYLPYKEGYYEDFANLIYELKKIGYVYNNFKKQNFIIVDGHIVLIDIGKGFIRYTDELYKRSVIRCYEMLRYPFLSELEFKNVISKYYNNESNYIDSNYELFFYMCNKRFKEDLHDGIVHDLIVKYSPKTILDFGAGKCKIANGLSSRFDFTVYDIDTDTINQRAVNDVKVVNKYENLDEYYEMVISNLVLCSIPDDIVREVLEKISNKLKDNAIVIFSICNPFFNHVQNTELRSSGLLGNYAYSEKFKKYTKIGIPLREEYHRPIETYISLLQQYGFELQNSYESEGVDCNTLLPISEHLIFECRFNKKSILLDDCTLLIKANPMEARCIYDNIKHIVCTLEKNVRFNKKLIVIDAVHIEKRTRQYASDDLNLLIREIEKAKSNLLIDDYLLSNKCDKEINKKYFGLEYNVTHSVNGQATFATIYAFDQIKTPIVFQTDSDILYFNNNTDQFIDAYTKTKVTPFVSLSIPHKENKDVLGSNRIEVRCSFVNLDILKNRLPFINKVNEKRYEFTWHRLLDNYFKESEKLRFYSNSLYFIHPENYRKDFNELNIIRCLIEKGNIVEEQYDKVNLEGEINSWLDIKLNNVVIYIRGRNVENSKLKRLFDSLKKQTYQDYYIVYIDDYSDNNSSDYAKFVLDYDVVLGKKSFYLLNKSRKGILANLIFVMNNIIKDPNTIVINLDSDDYFVNNKAIEIIVNEFDNGADITVGNLIRYDKPLKHYTVQSFDKVWEREGDNIWLHPKCFRRYLFDSITEEDLMIDGKYVDVNCDFAIMLPMLLVAKKVVFIDEILYYFEPSQDNQKRINQYCQEYKLKIRKVLLEKSRIKYEKSCSNNRR